MKRRFIFAKRRFISPKRRSAPSQFRSEQNGLKFWRANVTNLSDTTHIRALQTTPWRYIICIDEHDVRFFFLPLLKITSREEDTSVVNRLSVSVDCLCRQHRGRKGAFTLVRKGRGFCFD